MTNCAKLVMFIVSDVGMAPVGLDYHITLERHHYSIPYPYARREVEARFTLRTVEIFLGGVRIAVHMRGSGNGHHSTIPDHMPSSHQRYVSERR